MKARVGKVCRFYEKHDFLGKEELMLIEQE